MLGELLDLLETQEASWDPKARASREPKSDWRKDDGGKEC